MTTSEQLERDAERARLQISATLDELRGRMTPGQVVDQIVEYMRDGSGATFVRNLRQQVVSNPVPVTLVGAGLAWLAMASRRPSDSGVGLGRAAQAAGAMATDAGRSLRDKVAVATGQWTGSATEAGHEMREDWRDAADGASQAGNGWAEQARSAASRFGEQASETGARMQHSAAAAASAVNDAASTAYDAAAQGSRQGAEMFGRAAGTMSEAIAATGRTMTDLFKDQPLILAGVGLALGALLGASLPVTEAEDRLMGEASDATKREAGDFAQQQLDKGKAVGQEALNAASRALDQQPAEHPRAEEDVHARPDASIAAEDEAGREAPLVPFRDSGVLETESHGAAGERERE
jgi:Protein of unknown function (DUF3618)